MTIFKSPLIVERFTIVVGLARDTVWYSPIGSTISRIGLLTTMSQERDNSPKSLFDLLEDKPKSLSEYRNIFKRRRMLFLLPAIGVFIGAVILALTLPSIYRSEATILIEDQEMPQDIVGATITGYATRQIELINQRLLTTKNIQEIVNKFEIYGPTDDEDPVPATALASWFRNDMEFGLVASDELESRRGGDPAIAFYLAFYSDDPELSQEVTEELVSLFLRENQRAGATRTAEVSQLLQAAITDASEELLAREAELAKFKERNEGALPELHALNLDVINRAEQQLSDVNLRIQQLQQRQIELSADLANISPSAPVTLPTGETIMSDRERLRVQLIDYRRKLAIYEEGHPDLVRLEREIKILQDSVGNTGTYELLQEQLSQERDRLSGLRDRYSDDHPDIVRSEKAIAVLQRQLSTATPRAFRSDEVADNPAYVILNTQLRTAELEIRSLVQKRIELEARIDEHEVLIRRAPQVEMQYEGLLRSYEDAKTKYADLQGKLRAADFAGGVQQDIAGRRFTLLEPPILPLGPDSPNRRVIILFGILLALAIGAGFVTVAEVLDDSIRGAQKLADIIGSPPLAVVPYLNNSADIMHARTNNVLLIIAMLVVGAASVLYVLYVVPQL